MGQPTVLFERRGDDQRILLTAHETNQVMDSIFIHNHPGIPHGFSTSDLIAAEEGRVAEMRVITRDGTVFRYRPTRDSAWMVNNHYDRVRKEVRQEMMTELRILPFEEDITEASKNFPHRIFERMAEVAEGLGKDFQYERILPND